MMPDTSVGLVFGWMDGLGRCGHHARGIRPNLAVLWRCRWGPAGDLLGWESEGDIVWYDVRKEQRRVSGSIKK